MVTKKKTAAKAKTRTVNKAEPRKRSNGAASGIKYIPAAAATVGLLAANAKNLKQDWNFIQTHNFGDLSKYGKEYVMNSWKKYIAPDNLVKSAIGYGAGYVGGEIAKKYMPGVIKRPMGKLAKKIPRV